jgi:hypothetical protein
MSTIRPRFPTDRRVVFDDGSITPAWDYFLRQLTEQSPKPGWLSISTLQQDLSIETHNRKRIDFRLDGSTYLDDTLQFPQLTGDVTNVGLETTLKNVGTPVTDDFVRITTDYAGRVISTNPVSVTDITELVDPVYVNVTGDTMTGTLTVPDLIVTDSISGVDTLTFDTSLTPTPAVGQLSWNQMDETLNLGLPNSVTLQIGQETYARVRNMTGATITNGSVVGFAGATTNALLITKYQANGAAPTLYILGVMTHDIPNGGYGYATVFGNVRTLDTSAFSLGDILYASATTAGAFTNVKQTAPNNVVPVAAVTLVGTSGSIFVRPSIEQDKYYTQCVKTADQSPAVTNTAYPVTFNSAAISKGFSIVSNSRITASIAGLYNFALTLQVISGSASVKKVWVWFRMNGTNIANSSVLTSLSQNNEYTVISRNDFFSLNANDYMEVMYACDSTNLTIKAEPATAFAPASPAAILAVTQVQQ